MNALPLKPRHVKALTSALTADGVVTVPDVRIGAAVEPATVDVVFVQTSEGIEVWLPEQAKLSPRLAARLPGGRPVSHGAQLLFSGSAALSEVLNSLQSLLEQQGSPRVPLTDLEAAIAAVHAIPVVPTPSAQDIATFVRSRIAGQDRAVQVIAHVVARHLRRKYPEHPASLLLCGPTGTGKTATARQVATTLAEFGYGTVQVNANEYAEQHRVSEILGPPPGYVGHGAPGTLADRLADHPKCVVIIDEIDKAHPTLLDTLMSVLSSGQLARSGHMSQPIDCRSALFLFTSNALGAESDEIVTGDEASPAEISDKCRSLLVKRGMRPEIAGRFSAVVPFAKLTEQGEAEVAARIVKELAQEYGVELTWIAPAVVAHVLGAAKSAFGARAVKMLADELVGDVFAAAETEVRVGLHKLVGPPWRLEPATPEGAGKGRRPGR